MGRESQNPGIVSDGTRAVHDRGVPIVLGRTGCVMVRAARYQHIHDISGLGGQVPGFVSSQDRSHGSAKGILFATIAGGGVGSGFSFEISCCRGHAGHSTSRGDSETTVSQGLTRTTLIFLCDGGRFHSDSDGDCIQSN
jgi:hypothetical protein